ncbi:hypothetical protein GOBAR_AA06497 [Gossypium barbadense]|uniref:Pentacotripeptide-repeat region of PRORP domain-containing protein n=1 Tax=Gossypium barbadense TaxID=3634 RepID=A0A2P5YER3_GOSBA|nr:hypothetical protein GOBAR_AA06497 [Gossypium barbadense]
MDRVEQALEIYRMMISDRLGPNIVTFRILIMDFVSYCRVSNVSEVVELSSEIEKLEILPDVITYSILIKGLCIVGKVEEGSFLLQKMNKDGVLANSVTYNSLINGYCKVGNMEKANLDICSQMNEYGVEPNVITFSTLIDGYCKTGNMEAVVGFYSEMVIKGLVPDVVAYSALINGYCKNGNIKEAFRLHKEMLELGLMPNKNCHVEYARGVVEQSTTKIEAPTPPTGHLKTIKINNLIALKWFKDDEKSNEKLLNSRNQG